MAKVIRVEMPDGSVWHVPFAVAARHRAYHYAQKARREGRVAEGNLLDFELFVRIEMREQGDEQVLDWARNNMDWAELSSDATQVRPPAFPNYAKWWPSAKSEVVS
jgi:hypothetical protein